MNNNFSVLLIKAPQHFWHGLQRREQKVIIGGVIISLFAIMLFFYAQIMQQKMLILEQQKTLKVNSQWMLEQASLAGTLINNCPKNAQIQQSPLDALELAAANMQLTLAMLKSSKTQYTLALTGDNGNTILRFAHQSACLGFQLLNFTIEDYNAELQQYEALLELSYK